MKNILLMFSLLGSLALPMVAKAQQTTDSETMSRQTYSEANRTAIGCSGDAWAAMLEESLAIVQHRQATTVLSIDLVKSLGDCSLKAQSFEEDNLTKLFLAIRGGLPAGPPPQGSTTVVDVAQAQLLVNNVWLGGNFIRDAEDTSEELQKKSLLKEDEGLLHDYLALVGKYNSLVSVLNTMPKRFPPTFVMPQPLHCTGYTNGEFTYTTCK